MIILVLLVIGIIVGSVLSIVVDEFEEIVPFAFLGGVVGGVLGALVLLAVLFIPYDTNSSLFETEYVLSSETEMTDFKAVGDGEYEFTDKNDLPREFAPTSNILFQEVDEDFRIETYELHYKNKHLDYLVPTPNKKHIIYRRGEE